jgi:uncharacterized protein (DUF58 family)
VKKGVLVVSIGLLLLFLFIPFLAVQLICLFVLAVFLLSYIYAYHTRYNLVIKRKQEWIAVYRYQKVDIEFEIENKGFLPLFSLAVIDSAGGLYAGGKERFLITLRARDRKLVHYEARGYRRGKYILGPVKLSGADPLGLFSWEDLHKIKCQVIIYPAIHTITLSHLSGLPGGSIVAGNKVYEDVTRFKSLREYTPGDEPRRIHWKASARLGSLFSKDFLPTLYYPILLVLNLNTGEYAFRHRYRSAERAIEVAASLIVAGIGAGQSVGLLSNGVIDESDRYTASPFGRTGSHGMVLLEKLACIKPVSSREGAVFELVRMNALPYGTRLIYIGPPLEAESITFLLTLKRGNTTVELYYLGWGQHKPDQMVYHTIPVHLVPEYGEISGEKIFNSAAV